MELPPPAGHDRRNDTDHESADDPERHETQREHRPRIYVASLSDYNSGILHGEWIDASAEPDDIHAAIHSMLERSPTPGSEEFAIHDYEHFGQYRPGEYDSIERVARVARGIEEHGPAFAAWAEYQGHDDDAIDAFEDAYLGEWASTAAYAEELLDDLGYLDRLDEILPDIIAPYVRVDIAAFAHDLETSGDITAIEHADGVWLFDGRG